MYRQLLRVRQVRRRAFEQRTQAFFKIATAWLRLFWARFSKDRPSTAATDGKFTYSLYRVLRPYNHHDAQICEEMLREWTEQEDEESREQYEFPEVEKGLPDCIRETLKCGNGRHQLRDRRLLLKHQGATVAVAMLGAFLSKIGWESFRKRSRCHVIPRSMASCTIFKVLGLLYRRKDEHNRSGK